jgi:hypothetical protein
VIGLPEPPAGSPIRVDVGPYDVRLSWRDEPDPRLRRASRAGIAAVVLTWVAAAGVTALELWSQHVERGEVEDWLDLPVLFAAAWTVLTCAAAYAYLRLVSPRPEVLVLAAGELTCVEGKRVLSERPRTQKGWESVWFWMGRFFDALRPRRRTTLHRSDILDVRLVRVQTGARSLSLRLRERRLFVGRGLGDADRAWLFEVLRRWKGEEAGA